MRKTAMYLVTALILAPLFPTPLRADGMMLHPLTDAQWRAQREARLINEPEQKAVIYFTGETQTLIISPSYSGAPDSFAWLVPVPARPKVEILKGAVFHELARLVEPKQRITRNAKGQAMSGAAPTSVTVLERKTVGAYDVSVLSATDSGALMKWLTANKYRLPKKATGPAQSYIDERWTFVACRIKNAGAAKGLSSGTLAPLRLTFPARKPVYPMRLSAANPQLFRILLYVIVPTDVVPRQTASLKCTQTGDPTPVASIKAARLQAGQRALPTLAGLTSKEGIVFLSNAMVRPADCTKDIVWTLPSRTARM